MSNSDEVNDLDKMLEDVERHTPKTGYDLVGVDDFDEPREQLYTMAHFKTWEEAVAGQKKRGGYIYPGAKQQDDR